MTIENKCLTFSPGAFNKIQYMRDISENEVAGFGITAENDPLYVEDFMLVKQTVGPITFEFDKDDRNRHLDEMAALGIDPCRCQRIVIHTP